MGMPSKRRKVDKERMTKKQYKMYLEKKDRKLQANAVEEMWPYDRDGVRKDNPTDTTYEVERKDQGDERKKGRQTMEREEAGDLRPGENADVMTVAEMLDAAPVPVLDTKFDSHYDPF